MRIPEDNQDALVAFTVNYEPFLVVPELILAQLLYLTVANGN